MQVVASQVVVREEEMDSSFFKEEMGFLKRLYTIHLLQSLITLHEWWKWTRRGSNINKKLWNPKNLKSLSYITGIDST